MRRTAQATSLALLFFRPGADGALRYRVWFRHYIPRSALERPDVPPPLKRLAEEPSLVVVPGDEVNLAMIRDDIIALNNQYGIVVVGFDPWQPTITIGQELIDAGVDTVEYRQDEEPVASLERAA